MSRKKKKKKKKKGGRELASIKNSVDGSANKLADYVKKSEEIKVASNSTYNIRTNIKTKIRKQKWGEKQLYGYFK